MTIAPLKEAGAPHVLARAALHLKQWLVAAAGQGRIRPGRPRPAAARPSRLIFGAALGIALIVATMVLLDRAAIGWQRALSPAAVYAFASVTEFGRSGWILIPCAVLLVTAAALADPGLGRMRDVVLASVAARVGFVFAAVALPGLLVAVGKRLIGRARPRALELSDPLSFRFFGWDSAYASLPSGHSTTAFAAAFALAALFPRWRFAWWSGAALIAVSRVAIAAHYPSDVVAGAVVGIIGALVVRNWWAVRRLAFAVGPDGTVRAMPGPSWRRIKAAALARM